MLTICTWIWGDKYNNGYVEKLQAGLDRHMKQEYRFRVFTPCNEDTPLTKITGCFARLRMFDPQWQQDNGIEIDDRLVCLDLDLVITGSVDELFNRHEPFVILKGANTSNPCPFNGSVMMLKARSNRNVWSDFSIEAASRIPFHEFPDDQGWLWYKLPGAAVWQCGSNSGIYAYGKRHWPPGINLPKDAKMVAFFGRRDPSQYMHVPWVQAHWR